MKRLVGIHGYLCCGIVAILSLSACAETKPMSSPSLYQRLGGKGAISAVVDTFVANVAADQRINTYFASTDIPQLKQHLVDQVCAATGGPCTYSGRTMKATHAGMGVGEADFTALVQDLTAALKTHKVGDREQGELLQALGSMKGDIVER